MSSLEQYAEWYDNLRKVSVQNPLNASVKQRNVEQEKSCNIKSSRTKRTSKTLRDQPKDKVLETDDDEEFSSLSDNSSGTGRDGLQYIDILKHEHLHGKDILDQLFFLLTRKRFQRE